MKKINTIRMCGFLILSMMTSVISAQFTCYVGLTESLNPVGEFTLFPEDLLAEGDLTGLDATVSQVLFTCDDLGTNEVVLEIYDGGELIFSCTTNIIIEDDLDPNVICKSNPEVVLEANGEYFFSYPDIGDGTLDNCGITQYVIEPFSVKCGDPNPLPVTLTVIDAAGNSASCTTDVTWSDYPDPTSSLACNDDLVLFLVDAEEVEITADMILEGGPYACPNHYLVEISENMIPRPEPIVTLDDTNKTLLTKITDPSTGIDCWGELHVYADGNCGEPFVVCDTLCRSSALGDCSSAHTSEDNVEWPCDIFLEFACGGSMVDPTPTYLLNHNFADLADIYPEIINPECFITGVSYEDVVFLIGNDRSINRKWRIIDWQTSNEYTYTQLIYIATPGLMICDTLPWNAAFGDCTSGHTMDDDVEWPADITVSTLFISPQDLQQNPEVASEDAQPQLTDSCGGALMNYTDVNFVLDDTTVLVERTWGIYEASTDNTWNYVQEITIQGITGESIVCVTREDGEPIPGVTLAAGIVTDETGCYSFANPTGITVTPMKDSPIQDGVNLLDKIIMLEGVLGVNPFSFYQRMAADLSQNGIVSTLDVVLLDKLLDGTLNPEFDHNWMFFDQITHAQSMDISDPLRPYHFIGVKMGDLDNSFPLPGVIGMEPIGLRCNDEILNKKELYQVDFEIFENTRVLGFTITIESPENNLNFMDVQATALPGFSFEDHVIITPSAMTINYIAPDDYLNQGIALAAGSTLFTIELSPVINTFLSQEIKLGTQKENVLRSSSDISGLEFTLDWENVIISSVIGVDAGLTLEFFPNPVTNEIRFKGLPSDRQGLISVMDPIGRVHYQSVLSENADLSDLPPGLYYLNIRLENGKMYTAPLTKM